MNKQLRTGACFTKHLKSNIFLTLLHLEKPKLHTILAFFECKRVKFHIKFGILENLRLQMFSEMVTCFFYVIPCH